MTPVTFSDGCPERDGIQGARDKEPGAYNKYVRISYVPRNAVECPFPDNRHSHSIVAGGFELISYTTLLTPLTLFMISLLTFARKS